MTIWQESKKNRGEVNRKIFSSVLMITCIFFLLSVFFFFIAWGLMELEAYFKIGN